MRKSELRKLREQKIISFFNKVGVSDIDLFKRMNIDGLGNTSDRNVLRVLNKMVDDGLLDERRKEVKLFSVSGRGFGHYEHRLMMNRFLINKGWLYQVEIEPKVKVQGIHFQPDFIKPMVDHPKNEHDWLFFEVDRKQKRKANQEKIDRYKRLGLRFEVVTTPDRAHMWKGCKVNEVMG